MKNLRIIFTFSFSLSLLLIPFVSYANQANLSTYYPSPSGSYAKIHLINQSGGPNENTTGANACFCAQNSAINSGVNGSGVCDTGETGGVTYFNAGTIFADPSTGYLEICKKDGTAASYPGSCFNRFGSATAAPSCPNNYQVTDAASQGFAMNAGTPVKSWSCCFTGQAAAGAAITKSGCFSIYSTTAQPIPASCSSEDTNAYDAGCDVIAGSATDSTTTIFKRNCCFNDSSGSLTVQHCGGYCSAAPANTGTICTATPPAINTTSTIVAPCGTTPCTYPCASGYHLSGSACAANVCAALNPSLNATACGGTPPPATNGAAYTLVGSCGATACTASCNSGYHLSGSSCVPNCTADGTYLTSGTCCNNDEDACGLCGGNGSECVCYPTTCGTPPTPACESESFGYDNCGDVCAEAYGSCCPGRPPDACGTCGGGVTSDVCLTCPSFEPECTPSSPYYSGSCLSTDACHTSFCTGSC